VPKLSSILNSGVFFLSFANDNNMLASILSIVNAATNDSKSSLMQQQYNKAVVKTKLSGDILKQKKRSFKKDKKTSARELEVQMFLNCLFYPHTFKKVKMPEFKNPKTGRSLELDLYCPELKLAVEISGSFHIEYNSYFHRSYQDFLDMKERDMIKSLYCQKAGIKLIIVPEKVPNHELFKFIMDKIIL